ncbi:MAG: DnaJ domain-containing protein [Chromatiaceae bacterium]|nr:DnaJ domain-containing protein [Chromatiaceae bacterium]
MRALIALVAIACLYLVFRWFVRQPRGTRLQTAAVVIGVALIALSATGRLNWVFALFGAVLPFLRRLLALLAYLPAFQRMYRQFKSAQPAAGQPAGQQSTVEARFVSMTLDHDTGEMHGSVLEGRFAGNDLQELSLEQLLVLLAEYTRKDEESAALLRAYLDREHGDAWQDREQPQAGNNAAGFSSEMTRHEAYEILGLDEGATEEQVIEAHRRLMQKVHPDRGGSGFLASKINQAKALLLSKG